MPGVPVSVAAHLLGLSERTARDWQARALDPVPGAKPARVSTSSLAKVLPAVERLRELGQDRELLRSLVDRREDERVLSSPRVKKLLEQLRRREYRPFSSEISEHLRRSLVQRRRPHAALPDRAGQHRATVTLRMPRW